jgi:hypothetical protein
MSSCLFSYNGRFYGHDSLLSLSLFLRIEKFVLLSLSFLRPFSLLYPAFREGDGLIIQSAGRHDAGF